MKIKLTFAFLWLFCISAIGQEEEKKEEIQYNSKKTEIGIDFQSIFRDIPLGLSLVVKRRIGEKKFISKNEKKALRLKLRTSGFMPIASEYKDSIRFLPEEDRKNDSQNFIFLSTGIEWQKQRNRIQYFYGFDVSISAQNEKVYRYATGAGVNINFIYYDETKRNFYTTRFNGLGGVKFFLSPEFSISLDTSFGFYFRRTDFETYRNTIDSTDPPKFILSSIDYTFGYGWDYLNTLNLSYYF